MFLRKIGNTKDTKKLSKKITTIVIVNFIKNKPSKPAWNNFSSSESLDLSRNVVPAKNTAQNNIKLVGIRKNSTANTPENP